MIFPVVNDSAGGDLEDVTEYVRNNAGKAFEFMLEKVEEDRKAAGLPDIATVRADAGEDPEVNCINDRHRTGSCV